MKHFRLTILIALFAHSAWGASLPTAIQSLADQLSQSITAAGIHKVGVTEFPDLNGHQSSFGKYLAEELTTQLFAQQKNRAFDIVERRQLDRLLQEQKLASTALFDPPTASRLGKLLGIDALITGSVTYLPSELRVNARILSVESGRTIGAAAISIDRDESINALVRQNPGASTAGEPAQRQDVYFENEFVRVTLEGASRTPDQSSVALTVKISNIQSEPLELSFESPNELFENCEASLVDQRGQLSEAQFHRGRMTGLTCYFNYGTNFTTLQPDRPVTVLMVFQGETQIKGSAVSFNVPMIARRHERVHRFSIGMTNVELANWSSSTATGHPTPGLAASGFAVAEAHHRWPPRG